MSSSLRATLSDTPLAHEHRAICDRLERIEVDRTLQLDRAAHDPALLRALGAQWLRRMRFEHRSSTVFSQLSLQLFEANASLDAQVVMARMAQDELRHTETCAEVVRALGSEPTCDADFTLEPLARHAGVSAEERALRNVIYTTCCSEMIACARFVATLDRVTEPFLRQAMRRLLSDEILHGQFGFHYLEAWRPWLDARPEVIASLERYLRHAFVSFERELAPVPPFRALSEEEMALGADDPALAREVFYATVEGAIAPGIARFGIDAERAWRERALAS